VPKRKEERLQGQSYDGRVLHYQEVWGTHPPTLPGLGQRQRLVVESELKTFFSDSFFSAKYEKYFCTKSMYFPSHFFNDGFRITNKYIRYGEKDSSLLNYILENRIIFGL
jgi:hypothetical protein